MGISGHVSERVNLVSRNRFLYGENTGCWFTSDLTRLLVNFIQRWVIIVSILAIYIRLYFIIYKAHRGTVSDEEVSVVLNVMPIGSDPKSKRDTHTVSKIKIRGDAKALKRVRISPPPPNIKTNLSKNSSRFPIA